MAMVEGGLVEAGKAIGFDRNRMPELLELVDIPQFRVTGRRGPRTDVAWDDAIDSGSKLWDALCAHGWLEDGKVDMERFRRLKKILGDRSTTIPAEVVHAELRQSSAKATSRRYGIVFAADGNAVRDAMAIANAAAGRPNTDRPHIRSSRPMSHGRFVSEIAPELERLPHSRRDPTYGASHPDPNERWLGRAAVLASAGSRRFTGVFVMVCGTTMKGTRQGAALALLEQMDSLAGGRSLEDDLVAIDAMRAIVVAGATGASDKGRLLAVVTYRSVRKAMRDWLTGLSDAEQRTWHKYLLPELPSDVAYWQPSDEDDDGEGSSLDKATRRNDETERQAREVSRDRARILAALELRKAELDLVEGVLDAKLAVVRAAIEGGREVRLPVVATISFPVVLSDGSLGVGRQSHDFEIDTVASFRRRVIAVVGRPAEIDIRLSSQDRAIGRAADAPVLPPGRLHDPVDDARLVVAYRRTLPIKGGECVEPFWVKLFRYSALRRHRWLTRDMQEIGGALAKRLGAEEGRFAPQLLSWEVETDAQLNTWCVKHLGLVIWPVAEFCHGYAIARACIRTGLLGGLRLGESTQARDDPGAFRPVRLAGRLAFRLTAFFKGRIRRSRNLDPTTMASWTDVHRRILRRWFGGREVRLPRFAFWDANRQKECVPAGYLVRNETRTLYSSETDLLIRTATFDVVDATSHAYKSGFATMMVEEHASEAQVNRGLNHEPGSFNSGKYSVHAEEAATDELISSGQERAEAEQLLYGFMENY